MLMLLLLHQTNVSKNVLRKQKKMHQVRNARLDKATKRSEGQFTYPVQMLRSTTEGKLKCNKPDEAAEKRTRLSVESQQQPGPSRASKSVGCSQQRQVKQRARKSAECPKRKIQVSSSDRSSFTRPYDGSDEETQSEEFVMHNDQNCIEDIRLIRSCKTKDRPRAKKKAENPVLDEIK